MRSWIGQLRREDLGFRRGVKRDGFFLHRSGRIGVDDGICGKEGI